MFHVRESLQHIISSCVGALREGRYKWYYNEVLRTIAKAVENTIEDKQYQKENKLSKLNGKENFLLKTNAKMLNTAHDWQQWIWENK